MSARVCSVVEGDCKCPPYGGQSVGVLRECYACGDDTCTACSTIITYNKRRARVCFTCQDMRKVGRGA